MRFLIVKTSALGDIIHTFPALSYLKKKFPEAKVDWVVEEPFSELVNAHPQIDQIICIKSKQWRGKFFNPFIFKELSRFRKQLRENNYDAIFDLQGNLKSALVTLQARSRDKVGFGLKTVKEWPNTAVTNRRCNPPDGINIRNDYLYIVQQFFKDNSQFLDHGVRLHLNHLQKVQIQQLLDLPTLQNKPLVMICPGAHWRNKQLPIEGLLPFLGQIINHLKCQILIGWGSPDEQLIAKKIHAAFPEDSFIIPKLPLPVLQNLMAEMKLVIAMDSLPLHLAGTTSTPTFSVFGPSLAKKFKPEGEQHYSVQGTCPYGKTFDKRCPILRTCKTGHCINNITGDKLFQDFDSWWQKIHHKA